MKFRTIFILFLFLSLNVFSQVDSIDVISNNQDGIEIALDDQEEEYVDEESSVIEAEGESAKALVKSAEELLSYVNILIDRDSLVYHFCILKGETSIIPLIEGGGFIKLDKKFDVIFYPNTNKVMYVREMIMSENQAWDFIYERIFDENGLIKMFNRHYSTFNSACAEVAFELSEYFYDEKGEIIKKTFEIFDGGHNPLNINDCWMEREDYIKEKTFNELNAKYNLPIEGLPLSPEIKDNNDQEEIKQNNIEKDADKELIQEETEEEINQE